MARLKTHKLGSKGRPTNYIQGLLWDREHSRREADVLETILYDLREYLHLPKFQEDPMVNKQDILARIQQGLSMMPRIVEDDQEFEAFEAMKKRSGRYL